LYPRLRASNIPPFTSLSSGKTKMETAIGVFSSRDLAEKALAELLRQGVPEKEIVFLTRSESEARTASRELATYAGGLTGWAAGATAGAVIGTLLIPAIGPVFALGLGGGALLGLAGLKTGSAMGDAAVKESDAPQPTSGEASKEDVAFFQEVLLARRSLIVVRSEDSGTARKACEILDRMGLAMEAKAPAKMQTSTRHIGDVTVLDISGRITLGEGNLMLREVVNELADQNHKRIVLNLADVHYIDSSGIGELVKTHTTIRNKGGHLKLANLNKRVHDLLEMTHLSKVFDVQKDETSAVNSFQIAS